MAVDDENGKRQCNLPGEVVGSGHLSPKGLWYSAESSYSDNGPGTLTAPKTAERKPRSEYPYLTLFPSNLGCLFSNTLPEAEIKKKPLINSI